MKIYIRGGIGDFLQCIPYASNNSSDKEFFIHTHFKKANLFFEEFGIDNAKYFYFQNSEEHDKGVDEILSFCDPKVKTNFKECPRTFYFDLEFSEESSSQAKAFAESFSSKKPIIGIHPFRSGFAQGVYSKFELPGKIITPEIIEDLVRNNKNFNYVIFGTPSDFENWNLSIPEGSEVKFTNFENIITSLALVKHCVKFIGVDSCFKTMSSSHKIKTYCLIGDFDDQIRDLYFIDQYVNDGFMKAMRVKSMESQKNEILDFLCRAVAE